MDVTKNAPAANAAPAAPKGGLLDLGDDFVTAASSRGGGQKIRPNVGYTLAKRPEGKMPAQQATLIQLINKQLSKENPVISEPALEKVLTEAKTRGELKTKQSAWRIFQYYRADLIERGVLKQVAVQ